MLTTSTEILTGAAAVAEGETSPDAGFRPAPRDPRLNARIVEAAEIWHDALFSGGISGMRARTRLAESLTTSDFPLLLASVIDRELLRQYEAISPTWQGYARRATVKDFKAKKLMDLLGGREILDAVPEGSEYPARKPTEAEYPLTVGKRGARVKLTWEMLVNDELDAFRDLPQRLAEAARETENYMAATLLVKAAGANTDFFKAANGNTPTALALSDVNLAAALTAVTTRKDGNRPIQIPRLSLVVPPALEMTALSILNATEIRTVDGTVTRVSGNNLRGRLNLVVDPYLTVIATDAKAATRWFLMPDPNGGRPAAAVGFLRGYEQPDLRVKADTGQRVGGGSIAPEEGSFDVDSIEYRVRHVVGAAHVDPKATYVSNGS